MKKIATLFLFLSCLSAAMAQSPITINAANFPPLDFQLYVQINNPNINFTPAANGVWDYSTLTSTDSVSNNFIEEEDPFFTSVGVDAYLYNVKNLIPGFGFAVFDEYDINSSGLYDRGIYVEEQEYPLTSFTGNANDNIYYPLQGYVYPLTNSRKIMQFPATYQSKWVSQSRRKVNFNLSVQALGLNNLPCQHIYTLVRTDTIIGWGKMRVYSDGVPSIQYDVLIDEVNYFEIDSFFSNGAPLPTQLLSAFGMSQGQQLVTLARRNVYRAGESQPLVVFNYANLNFTTPNIAFFDISGISPTTHVSGPVGAQFSTLIFPNPCPNGILNVQLFGQVPELGDYQITNLEGKILQNGPVNLENGYLQIGLPEYAPGQYILQIQDKQKQTQITEAFFIAR
jgi:hypothetical protein